MLMQSNKIICRNIHFNSTVDLYPLNNTLSNVYVVVVVALKKHKEQNLNMEITMQTRNREIIYETT